MVKYDVEGAAAVGGADMTRFGDWRETGGARVVAFLVDHRVGELLQVDPSTYGEFNVDVCGLTCTCLIFL